MASSPPPQPGGNRKEHRLFDEPPSPLDDTPRKPFSDFLRETPPAPLPLWVKLVLWAVGVLAALLLLGALVSSPRPRERRVGASEPAMAMPRQRAEA